MGSLLCGAQSTDTDHDKVKTNGEDTRRRPSFRNRFQKKYKPSSIARDKGLGSPGKGFDLTDKELKAPDEEFSLEFDDKGVKAFKENFSELFKEKELKLTDEDFLQELEDNRSKSPDENFSQELDDKEIKASDKNFSQDLDDKELKDPDENLSQEFDEKAFKVTDENFSQESKGKGLKTADEGLEQGRQSSLHSGFDNKEMNGKVGDVGNAQKLLDGDNPQDNSSDTSPNRKTVLTENQPSNFAAKGYIPDKEVILHDQKQSFDDYGQLGQSAILDEIPRSLNTINDVPDDQVKSDLTSLGGASNQTADGTDNKATNENKDVKVNTGNDSSRETETIQSKTKKSKVKRSSRKKKRESTWSDNWFTKNGNATVNYVDMTAGKGDVVNIGCAIKKDVRSKDSKVTNIGCSIGGSVISKTTKNNTSSTTRVIDTRIIQALPSALESIGLFLGKSPGSVWRAGSCWVVTAYHVVKNHMEKTCHYGDEKSLRGVEIVFGIKDGLKKTFRIEEKIHYHSESLDIAILKLLPNEYQDFPPPLRNFRYLDPVTDEDLALYLVGYPDASKNEQTVNLEVALWNPSDKRMRDLQEFCERERLDYDGYLGLNNSERLVVKCDFEHGASGCPGLLIDNGQVNVVTTFLRGYPAFYYSQWFKRDHREKYDFFPKDKMYQQGVKISALRDALKSSKFYHHILKDIFDTEQTLEPNTHVLTVSGH